METVSIQKFYQVAGHRFCVSAREEDFGLMDNYVPFAVEGMENKPLCFSLFVADERPVNYIEELRQEDEEQDIICGHTDDGRSVFEFRLMEQTAGWLVCSKDFRQGCLTLMDNYRKFAIDNALMVLFALATAKLDTALFHAAVVSYDGKGYMFLGKSGTGKSTHARLWLKHIAGTELVNDDNPVVRIFDGETVVYGSPWSGKTPCYRNVSYPLGGIVMLSQASFNKIRRLNVIEAYAALVSSISGKRWDKKIADGLHNTENTLATIIPTWHLECLPDEEAAKLCSLKIK